MTGIRYLQLAVLHMVFALEVKLVEEQRVAHHDDEALLTAAQPATKLAHTLLSGGGSGQQGTGEGHSAVSVAMHTCAAVW